ACFSGILLFVLPACVVAFAGKCAAGCACFANFGANFAWLWTFALAKLAFLPGALPCDFFAVLWDPFFVVFRAARRSVSLVSVRARRCGGRTSGVAATLACLASP